MKPKEPAERLEQILRLIQLMGALVTAGVIGVGAVFVWVNGQSTAVASIQQNVQQMNEDTKGRITEWSAWRMRKDEIDTRLITLLEEMQKNQERIVTRLERVEQR